MKHILLISICLLFTMQAKAAESGEGWSLSDDGTLTISADISYNMRSAYPWDSSREFIKRIVIEDGVTSIGNNAFVICSSLVSIEISKSVTSIGAYAFLNCRSLTSIEIPESVTAIGWYAFRGCSNLTSIKVDEDNTKYDSRDNCNAIIETESNTLIAGCQNTIIPESVKSIGNSAFSGCSSLTSIIIPESVTEFGWYVFEGCSGLESIKVDEDNTKYDSRDNCNAIIETASNTLVASCPNTIIPKSVTSIGNHAFSGCSSLTSIVIPEGVTSIGEGAFSDCSELTNIEIPASVTSIGGEAFYGCSKLISIEIPKSVTSIGYSAFIYCSSLTHIEIPKSVTSIDNSAFYGCSSLTSIKIPKSVTSIGKAAFLGCTSLTSVTIPESVTSIGYSAFSGCSGLTSVYSYAVTPAELEYDVFYSTNESFIIYIPKGTTEAYKTAWGRNYNYVEMPASFEYDSNYGDIKLIKWTSSEADVMTISIEPAEGYELQSITLDGVDLLQAANDATTKAVKNDDGTYTISGLSGDNLAVVVNFSVSTPVNTISCNQEAEIAAVYSLTGAYVGKSLENLQNGLYVVVYSNGKIDKVLVK